MGAYFRGRKAKGDTQQAEGNQKQGRAAMPFGKRGEDGKGGDGKAKARPVWLNELEESLVEALGTPVVIRYGRKRSQIVIECAGREEFERVFQRLKNA